ncbi:LacI family DNA-binding transcriptional regulator [Agromyces neolithicus]|uniref:LacI family DNA-binding transcriptional regulator n=1 Tax=Agromyces neolithicus TaxID=269420 RepID=A0ABN2MBV3_9MICO
MARDEDAPNPTSPTIYDVARASGVAPSTVSRTFSRPGRVNAQTADRVRRIAAEMGYRAKPVVRLSLPGAKTALLAMVVPDVPDHFFNEIIRGAKEAANAADHTLLVVDAQRSATTERGALERLIPVVDGVILAASTLPDSSIRVVARQRPTVVVNRAMTDVASVLTDNADGMSQAVAHLAALGHRELTYVAGPAGAWTDGTRWRAFRAATQQLGLRTRRIGPTAPTQAGGHAAAHAFTEHATSGVIAFNDSIAVGFMRGLAELGMRVPDDVSVIGFDSLLAGWSIPPLTSLASPLRHLGSHAVRIVLAQQVAGRPGRARAAGPLRPTRLPAKLVVRDSTAPPARRESRPVAPDHEHAA